MTELRCTCIIDIGPDLTVRGMVIDPHCPRHKKDHK